MSVSKGADPAEVEAIYRARLADFRRVAAAIVGDVERGSDAVQEAFELALRKRTTFRGEGPLADNAFSFDGAVITPLASRPHARC